MATTDRLAEVQSLIVDRDADFKSVSSLAVELKEGEKVWPLSELKLLFGYGPDETISPALHRAKISAANADWDVKEHFVDGSLYDNPGEVYVTKFAALLVLQNADVEKKPIALVQSYFALQVDRQRLEDERRIRIRLEVQNENKSLLV